MQGSKNSKKAWRKLCQKAPYWQGWCHISNKSLRRRLRQTAEDVPDGGFYRKVGTWFEWN